MCFSYDGIPRVKHYTEGGSNNILRAKLTVRLPRIILAITLCKVAALVLGSKAMAAS